MQTPKRPHIFLDEFIKKNTETGACRPPSPNINSDKFQVSDPVSHGIRLLDELNVAVQAQSNKNVSVATVLTIGHAGEDLCVKSLQNRTLGMQVLNFREVKEEEGRIIQQAVIALPFESREKFGKKFQDFSSCVQSPSETNRPNAALCHSINSFAQPKLTHYWIDESECPDKEEVWCQVWVQREIKPHVNHYENMADKFRLVCESINLRCEPNAELTFPETQIFLVRGNKSKLQNLIEEFSYVSAICLHRYPVSSWTEMKASEQRDYGELFLTKTNFVETNVSVCLLDTGVTSEHPLLKDVIKPDDCHVISSNINKIDEDGHGTGMAGLIVYGDMSELLDKKSIEIRHRLESVKILPNDADKTKDEYKSLFYGQVTQQAVYRVEAKNPNFSRIVCMAVSATESLDGLPDDWSSAVDQLAYGDEEGNLGVEDAEPQNRDLSKRLVIISAGNVSQEHWINYPESNKELKIESPGQSWNALVVGACTTKYYCNIAGETLTPLVAPGGLAPASKTSLGWSNQWPLKPDVLFEGGNCLVSKDKGFIDLHDDLEVLTTSSSVERAAGTYFATMRDTSSATALVSRMAAMIQERYPQAWPETVRAILINSADWTDEMLRFPTGLSSIKKKEEYKNVVRCCGFGAPNFQRAYNSWNDSLTLIIQDVITPYRKIKGKPTSYGDAKIYTLPWPQDLLIDSLGTQQVRLRVALSYFISPNPTKKNVKNKYQYQSHSLDFAINGAQQNLVDFKKSLFKTDDPTRSQEGGNDAKWKLGVNARKKGSLHADIWEGSAADLATRKYIAVYPNSSGWWKDFPGKRYRNQSARFSLVVSLQFQNEIDVDIWNAVQHEIQSSVQTEIMM